MTRAQRIAAARERVRAKLAERRARRERSPLTPKPRYDEAYWAFRAWLDRYG